MIPCKIMNSIYFAIINSQDLIGKVNINLPLSFDICDENFINETIKLTTKNKETNAMLITDINSATNGILINVPHVENILVAKVKFICIYQNYILKY